MKADDGMPSDLPGFPFPFWDFLPLTTYIYKYIKEWKKVTANIIYLGITLFYLIDSLTIVF